MATLRTDMGLDDCSIFLCLLWKEIRSYKLHGRRDAHFVEDQSRPETDVQQVICGYRWEKILLECHARSFRILVVFRGHLLEQ